MPTPYQLDFFDSLKKYFDLRVVYFTAREADRQWQLSTSGEGYSVRVLKNSRLALWIQKRIPSFHFSTAIIGLLRKDEASCVLVNGTYWSPNVLLALWISYRRKKKLTFWTEAVFPVSNPFKFAIKKMMLWPVKRCTHFLSAIGKPAIDAFQQYGYKKKIYNIPYNIDTEKFRAENLDRRIFEELKAQYKSKGETIFFSSGSLIRRKGMDTLVKAFLQLPQDLDARLIIAGDGEEKENLRSLAAGNDKIHFIGFQEKNMVPCWFNLADVFVFASRYDGWGLVINEAIAAGNAIICSTATGAATDKLTDGENAVLLDAEDINGYATAMKKMATDKTYREMLRSRSNQLRAGLSSQYNAEQLHAIFKAVE